MKFIDPKRLKQLRTQHHLTRDNLSERSSVSERQIARIEASKAPYRVRIKTAERLAGAFGVRAAELAGDEPPLAKQDGQRAKPIAESIASCRPQTCAEANAHRIQSIQAQGLADLERTVPTRACARGRRLGASDRAHRVLDIVCKGAQGNSGTPRQGIEYRRRRASRQVAVVRTAG